MANSALRAKAKRKNISQENISRKNKKVQVSEKNDASLKTAADELQRSGSNFQALFLNKIEDELKCNICTEVLIKPTVLNCSHTFCEYCIVKWKKQQRRCPICREKIDSQLRVLALDSFLDKSLELLAPDQSKARREIISQRDKKSTKTIRRRSERLRNRRQEEELATTAMLFPALEMLDESFYWRTAFGEVLHLVNNIEVD